MKKMFVALAALLGVFSAGFPAEAATWTIPGIVNASGLNNTRFVSDLAVTNPGPAPATATLAFLPAGLPARQVTLAGGETVVYRGVLDRLWGASLVGAVQVTSDAALVLRARTYNTASSGTYGAAVPVIEDDRFIPAFGAAQSLWVSQSPSGVSGYRTNLAVVFPDAAGGAATVTLYNADGNEMGSKAYSLDAGGFQQASVASFATGSVPVGRARIVVTRGRAAGYASVVDNVTGDSSIFPFEALPAGRQDVLVNGVARASGRNDTFFRTDGRFYNPTPQDAVVTVSFHASGDSNGAPATRDVTIPAGKILDVTDVLDALLGLPVGSSGALRFRSAAPVGILCRTSNVDPTGLRPGTFGAQQGARALASFLSSADTGAVVTGLRQNTAYRTNIGLAGGEGGVSYRLTLRTAAGATVATATGSLGSFGWTQPSIAALFPGTPVPDDGTLLVQVTAGSVDVFDSSIDQASGDSVVTPIAPLPVEIPSSATIGSQGGSIRSSDGRFTLKVPAGALSTPTAFSVVQVANDAPDGVGPAYEVTPDPLEAAGASRVVLTYLPADLAGTGPAALGVAVDEGAAWRSLQAGAVDTVRKSISAPLSLTSGVAAGPPAGRGGLAQGKRRVALFTHLSLDPKAATLLTNGSLTLQIRATGPGVGLIKDPLWLINSGPNGTLTPNGLVATFTAPAKAPSDPVTVLVTFSADGEWFELESQVRIVSRRWILKATGKLGWSCGRIPGCYFGQSYLSQHVIPFDLDESFAISSVNYGKPDEMMDVKTACAVPAPTSCPGPFIPAAPVTPMEVTGLSGQYLKENRLFAMRIDFKNAFSGFGSYDNCTQGENKVVFVSTGMEILDYYGFERISHVNTFVGNTIEVRIYRYEDIYSAVVELIAWD